MADGRSALARRLRCSIVLATAVLLAGCSELGGAPPQPTPLDFPGLAGQLALEGLIVAQPRSGDSGCSNPTLRPTAISFDLSGLGVTNPIRARVFMFADRAAYDRRRLDVDTCTAAWATNPGAIEFIDAPPFVLVIQGPIPSDFKAALTRALTASAGGTN